jgi:RpiR family transcriptional regulator, carbohydrate utilization regulator
MWWPLSGTLLGETALLIGRIERERARLRPSEARVADFVLGRPHVAAELSIRDLADSVGVSEPTVIRFCRAVGCVGFQELKRHLTRDLERRAPATNRDHNRLAAADTLGARLLADVGAGVADLGTGLGSDGLAALGRAADLCAALGRVSVIATDPTVPRAAADLTASLAALGIAATDGIAEQPGASSLAIFVASPSGARSAELLARAALDASGSAVVVAVGASGHVSAERLACVAIPVSGDGLTQRLHLLAVLSALVGGVEARLQLVRPRLLDDAVTLLQASRERAHADARRAARLAAEVRDLATADRETSSPG